MAALKMYFNIKGAIPLLWSYSEKMWFPKARLNKFKKKKTIKNQMSSVLATQFFIYHILGYFLVILIFLPFRGLFGIFLPCIVHWNLNNYWSCFITWIFSVANSMGSVQIIDVNVYFKFILNKSNSKLINILVYIFFYTMHEEAILSEILLMSVNFVSKFLCYGNFLKYGLLIFFILDLFPFSLFNTHWFFY